MNFYKFVLVLKEFLFLANVLRKQVTLDLTITNTKAYVRKVGFKVEEEIGRHCKVSFVEKPDSLTIKKADSNLLSMKPCYDEYSWSGGGHYDFTNYCSVVGTNDNAELLWLKREGNYATGSGDRNSESCTTIGEQLMELNIDPDFIVCYDFKDTDDNGNGETQTNVIIYKMKDFDLAGYHCQQIDKAATQLKSEIHAACR
jgi:hypothetical protein